MYQVNYEQVNIRMYIQHGGAIFYCYGSEFEIEKTYGPCTENTLNPMATKMLDCVYVLL